MPEPDPRGGPASAAGPSGRQVTQAGDGKRKGAVQAGVSHRDHLQSGGDGGDGEGDGEGNGRGLRLVLEVVGDRGPGHDAAVLRQGRNDAHGEIGVGGRGDHPVEVRPIQAGLVDGKGPAPGGVGDGAAVGSAVLVKEQGRAGSG